MRSYFNIGALVVIAFLVALSFTPALAQVLDAEPVIAPSSIWYDVWTIVQPIVVLLVSTVGPVLVTWIAARIITLLKVSDEKQKLEIEAKLRDALHQSAANALKMALTRAGVSGAITSVTENVIFDAVKYVQQKSPDAIDKLGVQPDALRDIILSKVPDLLGVGARVGR